MDTPPTHTDSDALLRSITDALVEAKAATRFVGLLVVQVVNHERIATALGVRVAGDVAAEVSRRLSANVKPTDKIMRIGDGKFAVLIGPVRNQGLLVLAANKLVQVMTPVVRISEHNANVNVRIGIAMSSQEVDEPEALLRCAETALLSAGIDELPYTVYSPAQGQRAKQALGLELEIDAAIKRGEFEVYYQPKVSAIDFAPCGAEALLRWTSPTRGPVSPDIFIPLVEKMGLIEHLTSFVVNTALRQSAEWTRHWGRLSVAVNVTPRVIADADLSATIESALGMWDTPANALFVELTESAIMNNPEVSMAVLRRLREVGVQVSIDDFGTGYSSLSYFKNIPADELKIDKSFVLNMFEDRDDKQIVRTVIDLAKSFSLKVTAEGVEDARTAAMLAALHCDRLQGYYYSRPLPQAQFLAWLEIYREKLQRDAGGRGEGAAP
ncbi:MAG: bifunctional diguanylate cyclase/phosphodiesterase [Gammaproteobacteria bacterium]